MREAVDRAIQHGTVGDLGPEEEQQQKIEALSPTATKK